MVERPNGNLDSILAPRSILKCSLNYHLCSVTEFRVCGEAVAWRATSNTWGACTSLRNVQAHWRDRAAGRNGCLDVFRRAWDQSIRKLRYFDSRSLIVVARRNDFNDFVPRELETRDICSVARHKIPI